MVSIFKMNKTKHKIQFPASFIAAFSFFFILTCSEDPGQVVNTPGGAVIYFSPPSDEDLLYVRASFEDENEISREVIVSAVIDSLSIVGFAQEGTYPVDVLNSMVSAQDFGGINIAYENPTRAEVSLNMSTLDEAGNLVFRESFYTSQASSSYSFRGYDPVPTVFVIYVEDKWGNQTTTRSFEATPLEDIFMDKAYWSIESMPGDESFSEYGFSIDFRFRANSKTK